MSGVKFTDEFDRDAFEHRLTRIRHPRSHEDQKTIRGSVSRMAGRLIAGTARVREATVKRFRYDDHQQLRNQLASFIAACNFGRRLKTLKGLTPAGSSANAGDQSQKASP